MLSKDAEVSFRITDQEVIKPKEWYGVLSVVIDVGPSNDTRLARRNHSLPVPLLIEYHYIDFVSSYPPHEMGSPHPRTGRMPRCPSDVGLPPLFSADHIFSTARIDIYVVNCLKYIRVRSRNVSGTT